VAAISMGAALCVSAVAVFSAWAYGATETWASAWTQVLIALSTAGLAGAFLLRRNGLVELQRSLNARWVVPALLLLAFMVTQALNASHAYNPSGGELTSLPHIRFLPRSVDCRTTLLTALRLAAYAAVFWMSRQAARSRGPRLIVLWVVLGSATAMSVVTCLQCLGAPSETARPLTGRFVNPNNYAAYANLMIPVALALGRLAQIKGRMRSNASHPGYLFYLTATILCLSVFLSGSRGGALVCAFVVVAWGFAEWVLPLARRRAAAWPLWPGLGLPVALAVAFVLMFGTGPIRRELRKAHAVPEQVGQRLLAYTSTLKMFRSRWLCGVGAGAFAHAFPYYQPPTLRGYYRYTHNDWLQYLVELGVVGTALLAALGVGVVLDSCRRNRSADSLPDGWFRDVVAADEAHIDRPCLARGLTVALAGMGIHALIDFPTHIPAIAVVAILWMSILFPAAHADGMES